MTQAGTFDEWMADTAALINLIQELGDMRWSIKSYNSPHFSYSYDGNNWTFKYSRVLEPIEDLRGAQAALQQAQQSASLAAQSISGPIGAPGGLGSPHTYVTSGYITTTPGIHTHGMSNMTKTTPGINHIIIVLGGVNSNCIQSVQWIRKPNSGLVITNNFDSTFGTMEGGTARGSFLFLPHMKILVNDKIYSNDTPDAFTQDIGGDDQPFRYLDLLAFREKYDGPIY